MNISEPFIRRPVATTLLTIGVALAGVAAFNLLPVAPLPQVDFPTISVSAALPGASPEVMAATVATPLERALGRIAGVTRDDVVVFARQYARDPAVRSKPRHRRRGARRPGRHPGLAHRAADQPAEQSGVSQSESGRCADHDPGAHLGHPDAGADVRRRLDHHRAEAFAGVRRRARSAWAAVRCRRCAWNSIRRR